MTAKEHYDTHLSGIYSWMLGDFSTRMLEQKAFFEAHHIRPRGSGIAVDLGAGTGIQSVALAQLGYRVTAVDFSHELLVELANQRNGLPITTYKSDIAGFMQMYDEQAEVIVCMGDTLTHLPDFDDVRQLMENISKRLDQDGTAVFSFRDYSEEKKGAARFIHVKSDDFRSMICFLEYFPRHIMVHDLVIEKNQDTWNQKVGTYPKLRIATPFLLNIIDESGMSVVNQAVVRGMTYVVARKVIR